MGDRVGNGNGKEGEIEMWVSIDDVLKSRLACIVATTL